MPTKTPTLVRQHAGEPVDNLIVRAAVQAVNDDHYVTVRFNAMSSGAELRVTRDNKIEIHARRSIEGQDEIAENDRLRVLDALIIARGLRRNVRLYASNHPELSVHIGYGLSEEAALTAYRQVFHSQDHRLDT
jgi:hypothetical protein